MKLRLLSLLLVFVFCSYSLHAQNALTFDGIDDYVDCGASSLFDATNIRTLECWANFTNLTGGQEILSRSTLGQGIELIIYGGNLGFYCMRDGSNASFIQYPASNLTTGRWYHLVATWNGTRESMVLYVNGVAVGTRTDLGNINNTGIANPSGSFRIGQWSDISENRSVKARIDEVRVWSTMRTSAEINQSMFSVAPDATGLIAYYNCDEPSGTTLTNQTANAGLDGTLQNGVGRTTSPVLFASNALQIDGVDDYVTVPANAAYNIASGTVEFWARPDALSATNNACMLGVRGSGGARFSFHITPTELGFWSGTNYYTLPGSFSVGTWYHFAFVCNGTTTAAYVNGNLLGTYSASFGTANNQPLIIGRVVEATQFETFNGAIDEVRIWNTQRTQPEIQAAFDHTLTGSETGLVALFSFNHANAGGANAGMITAIDNSTTNNNGTLVNFNLSGTTSNFISNPLSVLPVRFASFTARVQNGRVVLNWVTAQEQNSASFTIERSSNGNQYHSLGQVTAAGNSTALRTYSFTDELPGQGKNYYRLKQTDLDGKSMYSAVRVVDIAMANRISWYATSANGVQLRLQNGNAEEFRVTDLQGRIILSGRLANGLARLSGLSTGMYMFTVYGTKKASVQFVVK